VPHHSYGDTYGKHREALEFTLDQHQELKRYCQERDVVYGCSVWDMTSAKEMVSLGPDYIKVPSALNTHLEMLRFLRDNTKKIHISLGMTKEKEEERIVEIFADRTDSIVLYACTSAYPVEDEDACILEIERIKEYGCQVGFSGHHRGIAIDIGAYLLGAEYIERHFTLDRTWKGTDHAASLEPLGLRKLKRDLTNVGKALQYKDKEILNVEVPQRKKLKYKGDTNGLQSNSGTGAGQPIGQVASDNH